MRILFSFALIISIVACGPAKRNPGDDDDAPDAATPDSYTGPVAGVTGRVYAPNQGPGQADPGQEIPIAGALVYVGASQPPPIPEGVYCEMCVATPAGGVLTSADGSFTLEVE